MTTDTAVLVSKMILDDNFELEKIQFIDNPEIPTTDFTLPLEDPRLVQPIALEFNKQF
jgi:ribosome biogenesis SPOUT family RNA methylase Rps3